MRESYLCSALIPERFTVGWSGYEWTLFTGGLAGDKSVQLYLQSMFSFLEQRNVLGFNGYGSEQLPVQQVGPSKGNAVVCFLAGGTVWNVLKRACSFRVKAVQQVKASPPLIWPLIL